MSRIWGLVTAEADTKNARGLQLQAEILCRHVGGSPETWLTAHAGLGHHAVGSFPRKKQPCFSDGGQKACVYCGKIFDYDSLRVDLEKAGARFEPGDEDPEFLMQWVIYQGPGRLSELNGLFACALWDERNKRLDLITDRYGLRMIYYHHDAAKGRLVFATELRGVVDSGLMEQKVNWPAWSTFLAFGHNLGDATAFQDVFTVPPGSVLTFVNNTIRLTKYWDINSICIDEHMSHDEAVEGLAAHFTRAMQRRNTLSIGRKAVFLSGGLDSRRIAAELHRQGAEFTSYTAGYAPTTEEVSLAARVAQALGVPNVFVALPPSFLMDYMTRGTALCDYETDLHQWILPLVDSLPADTKVNYDGLGGDIPPEAVSLASGLHAPGKFQAIMKATPDERALGVSETPVDFRAFAPEIRRHLSNEHVVESVKAELRKYDVTDNQLCSFYVLNRSRRGVSLNPYRLILLRAETLCPFLDNDLFEFTLRIPAEIRLRRTLRASAARFAYPGLAAIPPAGKGAHLRPMPPGTTADARRQRRRYLLQNIRRHFLRNCWLFDTWRTGPALIKDYVKMFCVDRGVSHTFNLVSTVCYLWMERYCPQGKGVIRGEAEGVTSICPAGQETSL